MATTTTCDFCDEEITGEHFHVRVLGGGKSTPPFECTRDMCGRCILRVHTDSPFVIKIVDPAGPTASVDDLRRLLK